MSHPAGADFVVTSAAERALSVRQQLIRGFLGVGAIRALAIPLSLACSVIVARMLGPTRYGQYVFVLAIVPLLALPVVGGVQRLLMREVARYSRSGTWDRFRGILRFSYGWVAGYSVILIPLVIVVLGFVSFSDADGRMELFRPAVFLVPLLGFMALQNGALKGLGSVAVSELPMQIIRPLAFLIVVSILAISGRMSPSLAVGGQLVAGGLTVAAGLLLMRRERPTSIGDYAPVFDLRGWSSTLVPMTMIGVVGTLNSQIGIILLGMLSDDAAVGALGIADSGAKLVLVSLTLVNMVIPPQIVRYQQDGDRRGLQLLARQSARAALLIAAPVALAFFVLGEPLVRLLFGDQYAGIVPLPLAILAFGYLASVFFGSVGLLLTMSGFEKETLRGQVIALVVNVSTCGLLIPRFGAVGAATGATLGLIVWNVVLAFRVRNLLGIRSMAV